MKKIKALLLRLNSNAFQTQGILQLFVEDQKIFEAKTLELPWRDNARRLSCIPTGDYVAQKHVSPKFGECFYIQAVPGRSEILIHKGNYHRDTLGCILLGKAFQDIDGDGNKDLVNSAAAVIELLAIAPAGFELSIREL